ncbi:MAG: hypothetical protein ACLQPD_27485 [Desulfomonilaceae bacterium]
MVFRTWHLGCSFVMVVALLCGVAWGQQAAPKASTQSLQSLQSLPVSVPGPMQLNWYIAARYSIFGPARLASVSSSSLAFPEAYEMPGPTISLANKTVSVMNETGASVPFSALTPGTNVIVCDRLDSVVVFTVTTTGVSNGKK